jgi:hypothetical protein
MWNPFISSAYAHQTGYRATEVSGGTELASAAASSSSANGQVLLLAAGATNTPTPTPTPTGNWPTVADGLRAPGVLPAPAAAPGPAPGFSSDSRLTALPGGHTAIYGMAAPGAVRRGHTVNTKHPAAPAVPPRPFPAPIGVVLLRWV